MAHESNQDPKEIFDEFVNGVGCDNNALQELVREYGPSISLGELIERIGEREKKKIWRINGEEIARLDALVEHHMQERHAQLPNNR